MVSATVYQRSRPLSDKELYEAIISYLDHQFVFRKLEIDIWLGDERVIYQPKDRYHEEIFSAGKSAEELWYDGEFEDWATCTNKTVNRICSEFMIKHWRVVPQNRKAGIKAIVTAEITRGQLIKVVKFNPALKQRIDVGRKRVSGVKSLRYCSNKRVKVDLNEGDVCYFCWNTKNPYIANPAYVFKKSAGSYVLIFFTNVSRAKETEKEAPNMARFIGVPADELGLTPEQAVLQRFC